MINKPIFFLWLIVFTLIIAFLVFYVKTSHSLYQGDNFTQGFFDFTNSGLKQGNIVEVRGTVSFYKDSLLSYQGLKSNRGLRSAPFTEIPSKWNSLQANNTKHSGYGYGTYHFRVIVPNKRSYGFKIENFKLAYNICVNGKNLGGAGTVGRTKAEMRPSRYQKEHYFYTETDTLDVLIQVSNFHHRKGGATGIIRLGLADRIAFYKAKHVGVEAFIIGLLFILFIYHVILFAYRSKDRSILYFSLLCLFMFLRAGYIGERLFLEVFSFLGWSLSTKLEYISFLGIPILTVKFINSLYPNEIRTWAVRIIYLYTLPGIVLVLALNSTMYSYVAIYAQFLTVPISIYIMIMLFVAWYRKRDYAPQVSLGFMVFLFLSIYDAISYASISGTVNLMPIGLFVVTFSQAYVLARKLSSAYSKSEKLTQELKGYVNNLEVLVTYRTKEIQAQNLEIEKQKQRIESKAAQLQTSNNSLLKLVEFKKSMTNMMVHDLKNPLNSIIGLTSIKGSIDEFKSYIYDSGWKMYNLIQNILDVERNEHSELIPDKLKINIKDIVDEAFNATRFMLTSAKLEFRNDLGDNTFVRAEKEMLARVIINILSNAAKYAFKEGYILVNQERFLDDSGKSYIKINIFNNGEAIPKDQLEIIFEKYKQVPNQKNSGFHSTGIGLAYCKLVIEAHGGTIGAVSGDEYGVSFWFTLPED